MRARGSLEERRWRETPDTIEAHVDVPASRVRGPLCRNSDALLPTRRRQGREQQNTSNASKATESLRETGPQAHGAIILRHQDRLWSAERFHRLRRCFRQTAGGVVDLVCFCGSLSLLLTVHGASIRPRGCCGAFRACFRLQSTWTDGAVCRSAAPTEQQWCVFWHCVV